MMKELKGEVDLKTHNRTKTSFIVGFFVSCFHSNVIYTVSKTVIV